VSSADLGLDEDPECDELALPHPLDIPEPGVEIREPIALQSIAPDPAVGGDSLLLDETARPEDSQVAADCRLAHPERSDELTHGTGPFRKERHDLPPGRIGEGVEGHGDTPGGWLIHNIRVIDRSPGDVKPPPKPPVGIAW
jgi:hypothetical protein